MLYVADLDMSCSHCPHFSPTASILIFFSYNNDITDDELMDMFQCLTFQTLVDVNEVLHAEVGEATANTVPGPH